MPKDPNEIGALWLKEKNGHKYLSGKINGEYVVVFKVKEKRSDKSPDYRVLRSQKREDATPKPEESDFGA